MTERFRNKYRSQSNRLDGYDYTRNGAYFVTICTKKHICYFGEIVNNEMFMSECGNLVCFFWREIPNHFANAFLDEFVIMPNHIHGIIRLESKIVSTSTKHTNSIVETPNSGVSQQQNGHSFWKQNSIGSIINQFKRICTIKSKSYRLDLLWQPRFYDHIIHSNNELDRIRTYIKNNPKNWTPYEHNNDIINL